MIGEYSHAYRSTSAEPKISVIKRSETKDLKIDANKDKSTLKESDIVLFVSISYQCNRMNVV